MERSGSTDQVFDAVAAPVRRAMLRHLAAGELPVSDLAAREGLSLSAASQHLTILRLAGLVVPRREGRQRYYRLDAAPLAELSEWVRFYEPFWNNRLTALGEHLEKKHE